MTRDPGTTGITSDTTEEAVAADDTLKTRLRLLAALRPELVERVLTLQVALRCSAGEEFFLALDTLADRIDADTDAFTSAVHALGYVEGVADALRFELADVVDV